MLNPDANEPEAVELPIEDSLDLHAFAPRDVKQAVEAYLDEAHAQGFPLVRIIHGRGIGVQREIVRKVLERTPFVAQFHDAPPEAGGWGATVITFRTNG
ncbi:MAG TPA: Smr/MutS family protein [Bryobacteraceae bacterium]|jgi:Mismatch repair ATPase (MutS family)|nr:Smr/MutS family protein [Bryobacteraceae bacterium]